MAPAGVDDVDDALDADVEHEIGRAVERRGAVDEGEVMHLVDAAHGGLDRGRVADVAADELDVALDAGEPPQRAAGIVVEHAHGVAAPQQRLDQRRADEAAAAGHQDAPRAHAPCLPGGDVDPAPGGVRAPRRVDQALHAIAFGEAGRRRDRRSRTHR